MSLFPWDLCPLPPFLFASYFPSLLSTWILPSTGGGVGGDSVCFQPFFFLIHKKKQKLSFLPEIQSLLILFLSFFFFLNRDRHGCSDKNPLAIFLSFYFSFSLFLSSFFFHDYLFSFFVQFSAIFFSYFYISIFFFLVFVVEAFLHLLPSALGTTRLWPVDFNLASKSHFLSNFSFHLPFLWGFEVPQFFFLLVNLAAKKNFFFFFLIGDLSPFQHKKKLL